jgi:oligoendopeptidase F
MPCHTDRPGCHTNRPGCHTEHPCGLRDTQQNQRESIERFHKTWEALMRQLDRINSLAHLRHTQRTEGQEAVSIAKHLLDKLGSYPELGGDAT